jgi:hypothetical protein
MGCQEDIFYSEIEEGVRKYVKALRSAGINTESSCHHEGSIQCQSLDPSTEIDKIRRVLEEEKVYVYMITLIHEKYDPFLGAWHQWIEITSESFKGK